MEQMKRKRKRDIAIKCCKTTAKFTFNLLALSLLLSPSQALAVDFKVNPLDKRLAKIAAQKALKKTALYHLKNNPMASASTVTVCAIALKSQATKKCSVESFLLAVVCGYLLGKVDVG